MCVCHKSYWKHCFIKQTYFIAESLPFYFNLRKLEGLECVAKLLIALHDDKKTIKIDMIINVLLAPC